MDKKQQAIADLLQGFLRKFGETAENQLIISEEISRFMKNREKIRIQDLDELEEVLLYRLCPDKKNLRRFSLSPLKEPGLMLTSKPSDDRRNSIGSSFSINKQPSLSPTNYKKLKSKIQDNIIFPSDYLPEDLYNRTSPVKYLTPGRDSLKFQKDEWGKIFRAEAIKYQKDKEQFVRKQKLAKLNYSLQLAKQIEESKMQKDSVRARRESEIENLGKNIQDYELQQAKIKQKRREDMAAQKLDYQRALELKYNKKVEDLESQRLEKAKVEKKSQSVKSEEKKKAEEKEEMRKKIKIENLNSAKQKILEKLSNKAQESQTDLIHLDKVDKDLGENEIIHKQIVSSKANIAHDEERLLKLVIMKPKSLREYEAEANQKEKEMLLKIIEEEKEKASTKKKAKIKQKNEVAEILDIQIKENEAKKGKYKDWIKEQGEIWKAEDDAVRQKLRDGKLMKKLNQKEIKATLDKQIKEKIEKSYSQLQLSPTESRINRNILNSALRVLGEDLVDS